MRFVIDETSWRFDELEPVACIESFEAMLDRLDEAYELGHAACYSEDLFIVPVWRDKTFYELYDPNSPLLIPQTVRERLAVLFARLPRWQDLPEYPQPPAFDVRIGDAQVQYAPSVAWAYAQAHADASQAVACISFPGHCSGGCLDVSLNDIRLPIWFVVSAEDCRGFFRWLIAHTTKNPHDLCELAPSAFPALEFVDGVFDGIKDMSKPYRDLVASLVDHLGTLSDHGRRIFSRPWSSVPAEFGSLGISISDENGKTKHNPAARTERTVMVRGKKLICWWHCKLHPDRDRIHICPDSLNNGGKLVIGIFCRHLT